ncbi:MAG: hypothetical protein IKD70_07660 [Eggerthellaceae bacterium]|nr:hypothetical protein [Eggerthellaceae bacterium]
MPANNITRETLMELESTRELYVDILNYCVTRRAAEDVESFAEADPNKRKTMTPTPRCLDALVQAGVLNRDYTVFGDQLSEEEVLSLLEREVVIREDVQVAYEITEGGKELLAEYAPTARLDKLFASKPQYINAYKETLKLCREPKTLAEVTDMLRSLGVPVDHKPGVDIVYPSFLLDGLQKAGVLVWNDGWNLTEEGRNIAEKL